MNDYRNSHVGKASDYDQYLKDSGFDAFMSKRERIVIARVIPNLFPERIKNYMDFACGTGRILSQISRFADRSTGVDVSESMMELARKKCPQANFLLGDITKEELHIGPFDLISSFRFFGNAQDELRLGALNKLNSLLTENGILLINNHRNPNSIRARLSAGQASSEGMDLSMAKLTRILVNAGFEIQQLITVGGWMVRHKYSAPEISDSAVGRMLEHLSSRIVPPSLAPDIVIIARKANQPNKVL